MEVEQDKSRFYTTLETVFAQSKDVYGRPFNSHFSYKSLDESEQKFSIAYSKLYQWLDSLTGQESYKIVVPEQAHRRFLDILEFLKAEGLARDVSIGWHRYNDAPAFLRCDITPAFLTGSTDGATGYRRAFGHGFGKDPATVLSKAIGEFLERYFLMLFHKKDLMRGSYASLVKKGLRVVDPQCLAGFSSEQKRRYPKRMFDSESIFFWEQTERVSTSERAFAPAQLIHWNYDVTQEEDEPGLAEINTNGAGGFFSKEGAVLSALYELIQRDAFLIYWLNSLAPPRINPESVPDDEFQRLLSESKRYGFEIHCLNTTLDTGIPTFVVVIIDPTGRGPYFSLGGGCEANPARALRRALEEAWSVYYWLRPLPRYTLPKNYTPFFDESMTQEMRLRLAANPDMKSNYQWFLNGPLQEFDAISFDYPRTFPTVADELNACVGRVEKLGPGYEVFAYLAKHPILKRLGYYSARVIVPKLVPLYLRETFAPLGSTRLREVPQKLGFNFNNGKTAFNPLPHPFP